MDLQVQTCVVDVETLIEHIHGIKKLVYDGRIRVLVPLTSTYRSFLHLYCAGANSYLAVESAEKIYKKSIEPKPEPKEAVRPKSSGRPNKVYPTFDINPHVAREFIDRCKAEESKLGVEFQKEAEEYTPWKNLKEQEEKQKASEAKPAGYAAALLAKLNITETPIQAPTGMANFLSHKLCLHSYPLGPAKPKLVARSANGPNSAWKKSVPTISADGVPASLRPILGYTLWRLHERETYSFVKDASILLTIDKEVSAAAHKVGINVMTFDTLLHQTLAHKVADTDLVSLGDVEREFGVLPPSNRALRNRHKKAKEDVGHSDMKIEPAEHNQLPSPQYQAEMVALGAEECGVERPESHRSDEVQEETLDDPEPHVKSVTPPEVQDLDGMSERALSATEAPETADVKEPSVEATKQIQADTTPPKPRAWADVVSNRIRPIEERYPRAAISIPELSDVPMNASDGSIDPLIAQVNQDEEKAITIADWVMKVKENMSGDSKDSSNRPNRKRSPRNKKIEKSSPPQEAPAKPFRPMLMQRPPKSSEIASDNAWAVSEKAHSPSPPPAVEITDEIPNIAEMLPTEESGVLKSTSQHRSTNSSASLAQTVASKDTSVAKTAPIEEPVDSEEEVVVFIPQAKRFSTQQQLSPKLALAEKYAYATQVSEEKTIHTKHLSMEEEGTVQQASPNKPIQIKQHRQPKPRAPIVIDPNEYRRDLPSDPQMNHQNGFHPPQSRPGSQHGPPRLVAQHGAFRGGARGGRPFPNPKGMHIAQDGQVVHPNASIRGGRNHRMPQANGQFGHAATNQNSVTVNGHNAHYPSPPHSPRISPQRVLQTNVPEADVDYVLQSGPPRGSTRGKGKLWIP